jgi:hypothetical protein
MLTSNIESDTYGSALPSASIGEPVPATQRDDQERGLMVAILAVLVGGGGGGGWGWRAQLQCKERVTSSVVDPRCLSPDPFIKRGEGKICFYLFFVTTNCTNL